jgi:hypothetical protein
MISQNIDEIVQRQDLDSYLVQVDGVDCMLLFCESSSSKTAILIKALQESKVQDALEYRAIRKMDVISQKLINIITIRREDG